MKTESLKKFGLTKEQIKYVMGENGRDINILKDKLKIVNENYKTLENQLNKKVDELSELNKHALELDKVHEKRLHDALAHSENYYQEQLLKVEKQCAKEMLFGEAAFASQLAKKAAMAEFDNKQFEFKDGIYVNAKAFFEELKQTDPFAFRGEKF